MIERERTDVSDGVSWYCPQCYTRKSIRQNSFFSKSRLPLQKWVLLIYFWVRQYPVTDAHEEAEVGEHTAIDIYQWLREVCSQKLLRGPPIVLGGPHTIVQIDESLFRHKPKVSSNFTIHKMVLVYNYMHHIQVSHSHTNSIIGAEQLLKKYGCLDWSTLLSLQHWVTWRLLPDETQQPYCRSSTPTQLQAQLFTLMNGQHTGMFRISLMFPVTEL